jgi:heme-degrading monooxygenase HmoA
MPVTELACLRLTNNLPLTDPTNQLTESTLSAGLKAQAEYTNAATYLLTQIEDPSYIYILGKWESVAQHVDEWMPSPTNQKVMRELSGNLEVVWLQHFDCDPSLGVSDTAEGGTDEGIPYDAPVVAIGRYFISPFTKAGFETTFAEAKHHLKEFKGPRKIAGGWRVDKEVDESGNAKEEYVQFTGWDTVEEHSSVAESEGFKDFARIKHFMQGAEMKHARWTLKA